MDHPAIYNVMRTGYPDGNEPQIEECEQCGEELTFCEGYEYDGEKFCGSNCIGEFLIEAGEARKSA